MKTENLKLEDHTGDPKLCPISCANVSVETLGGTREP